MAKYFESFIDSVQMVLPSGKVVVFRKSLAELDDETAAEFKKSHPTSAFEIEKKDFDNRRAIQAMNDPQDNLREEIRRELLQEMAEKQNVGGIGVTGGATPRQEGFRTEDQVKADAGIVKTSPETANAIATALGNKQ